MGHVFGHLLLFGLICGISNTVLVKAESDIVFPVWNIPDEMKPKKEVEVTKLPAGELYVVVSKTPYLVVDCPENIVVVDSRKGPVVIGGKFVGGEKLFEWKSYDADVYVHVVRGIAKGKVELVFAKDLNRQNIIRKNLEVMGGDSTPDPIPPEVSKFEKDLQKAFSNEAKEEQAIIGNLIEVYSETGKYAKTAKTWVDLFDKMTKLNTEKNTVGKLKGVKRVIQDQMTVVFPSGMLDPKLEIPEADRNKVVGVFDEVVKTLKKLK